MQEEFRSKSGSATRLPVTYALIFVVVAVIAAYAFHEHNLSKQLTSQNSAATSALTATRDQVSALTARLDAMTAERAAEQPAAHLPVYRKPMAAASMRHRIEDPRWKKMQGQLDDQAKQIDATRQDLSSARTELQGSIATTHDELVLLEKKGERSYFEFDLDKSGQFTREGPVGVRLHKANTKHEYADLEMLVDDFKVSKKHVNIYEPVVFYAADSKVPVELVINSITKNHIHGYVSEPKYKGADLEAMAKSSANNAATNNPTDPNAKPSPAVRQRLELPRN
ncbi:MAG TPA: hypothetical protein VFO46_16540 [Candidatus Sulfotelmatobacter sp.]|nr:hypothetical protein [Candidatus Sulfotelmatobacter sp.]